MHFIPIDDDEGENMMDSSFTSFDDAFSITAPPSSFSVVDPIKQGQHHHRSPCSSSSLFSLLPTALPNEEFEAFPPSTSFTPFEEPFGDPNMEPNPLMGSSPTASTTISHSDENTTSTGLFGMDDDFDLDPVALTSLIGFAMGNDNNNNDKKQHLPRHHKNQEPSIRKRSRADMDSLNHGEEPVIKRSKEEKTPIAPAKTSSEDKTETRFRPHQDAQWYEQYQKLLEYKEANGHCGVPITYDKDPMLARWVKRQRYQYKRYQEGYMACAINAERISLLEKVGFVWDAHAVIWQEKFQELVDYTRKEGHCLMPSYDPENVQLSTWVKCQRRQYKLLKMNKPSNMTQERIDQLNSLGFVWSLRNKSKI